MKAVFLNAGLARALRSQGTKLDGTEGLIGFTNFFTNRDLATIEYETNCFLKAPLIKEIGLTSFMSEEPAIREDKFDCTRLFGETVSPQETLNRIRALNCVVTQDDCLVFFENADSRSNVLENIMLALEHVYTIDDIMKMPVWSVHLKNS